MKIRTTLFLSVASSSCIGLLLGYILAINSFNHPVVRDIEYQDFPPVHSKHEAANTKLDSSTKHTASELLDVHRSELAILVDKKLLPLEQHLSAQKKDIQYLVKQIKKGSNEDQMEPESEDTSEEKMVLAGQQEALEQAQSFADNELLFELEEHDKAATAQLSHALANIDSTAAAFNLDGLQLSDSECRGQSCRVRLQYSGDHASLDLLPALLAAEGHTKLTISVDESSDGSTITALLNNIQ